MSYTIEVDATNEDRWSQMLDTFQDSSIYQTWAYGTVRWGGENLSHLVLKRAEEVVALAQLRIVRPTPLRFGIAHLRWGPVFHRRDAPLDSDVAAKMAEALCREYAAKRGLFLRVFPNASLETERAQVFNSAFSRYANDAFGPGESYRTIILDLDAPLEVLRKNLDQKWRNQLNRAEKNGLAVLEDDSSQGFAVFRQLYDEMMARKKFDGASDLAGFEKVQQSLPPSQKMKVLICQQDGAPVAGLVGTGIGNMGIYLMGATNELGMKSKGAYLLQWRMIQWLKERGVACYNLGGINPEANPGVYHFKSGLSGRDSKYLSPLVSCESLVSKGIAKAVSVLRGGKVRGVLKQFLHRG